MTDFKSDIILGEKYRDTQTGIEGFATCVTFFQFSCERAVLEVLNDGELKEYGFDVQRLEHIASGKVATTERTGGPGDPAPRQRIAPRGPSGGSR